MYCRSGLKRKLLAPGGLQYQDVGWAQCSFLWASFVTPLGPAYTAVFRTKCLCKAGRWHFPEPHTLGADEFTIHPCIFLCAKISVFSVETAFSEWEHFLKKGHFWFSAWFVGVPETVRSDTEMLARPKLLCKSNVSSNARCFVKRLHSWSSFLVGIWDAVHPCSSNCLFDSTLFILSMDARWSQLYSKIIRAPQGVWTARYQQWIKACFTQPIQIVRFEPVGPGFRSPLMLDGSIDTKIMVITETCWLNTNWCLDASPSVWFCGLTNISATCFNTFASSQTRLATFRKGPITAIMSEAWPTWKRHFSCARTLYFRKSRKFGLFR